MAEEQSREDVGKQQQKINEDLTKMISHEGIPFQRWCKEKINGIAQWKVEVEEYPTLNGEKIDLIAKRSADFMLCTVIECKKSHPDFKTWVFFEEDPALLNPYLRVFSLPADPKNYEVALGRIRLISQVKSYYTYDSREARYDYSKKIIMSHNKGANATSTERIYEACKQITNGLISFVEEKVDEFKDERNKDTKYKPKLKLFFPIVITNAPLVICHYNTKDVDLTTGELDQTKATYDEVPFVIHRHSFPSILFDTLLEREDLYLALTGDIHKNAQLKKSSMARVNDIFIVNTSHLDKFFESLSSYSPNSF